MPWLLWVSSTESHFSHNKTCETGQNKMYVQYIFLRTPFKVLTLSLQ